MRPSCIFSRRSPSGAKCVIGAVKPNSWADVSTLAVALVGISLPSFVIGTGLALVFPVMLGVGQIGGWGKAGQVVLPAITLGTYVSGIFARFLRASLLAELSADYVRTARAKGLPERQVIGSHALSNALLPFVTVVGLMTANFIGGAVVTEAVFTYPGLGRLLVQAISTRDYPLIQGSILVIMVIYMVANIVVDVIYAYIDPRIEYA